MLEPRVAVVIPTYKAKRSILDVLQRMPPKVARIFVVDDKCPDGTGQFVVDQVQDPRVSVIFRPENGGVGAATKTGYEAALAYGADVVVKLDSDGQMAPEILFEIAEPVIAGEADYAKGNRFWYIDDIRAMPPTRIFGNAGVSLLSKLASGYWQIFDPANGYTAISREALSTLPLHKIADRYFFESDMLFRLALDHRPVADVPMAAVYGDEVSGLKLLSTFFTFSGGYLRNFAKRVFIEYVLREVNVASVAMLVAMFALPIGLVHGLWGLFRGWATGVPSSTGAVMLTTLLLVIGYVSLMNFLAYDYEKPRHYRRRNSSLNNR